MAISVDWVNRIIHVPQADLTPLGGTLYSLDTANFRRELKSLEDDSEGMQYPDTHRHNTEVTVAGTTFARTIEIINNYRIEFEDGQYSVSLFGSNNNFFDIQNGVLTQNSVQIIPSNSAGLQTVYVETGSGVTTQDKEDIISGVWERPLSSHDTTGTYGWFVKRLLTFKRWFGLS